MKKICIILLMIPILFFFPLTIHADEELTIDKVEIYAEIDENGVMHVEEFFTYTFNDSFEGMTRQIESDVRNFEAFLIGNAPKQLEVEKDDDFFKIYSASENETKTVRYQYEVHGSIEKYVDVADMTYAFFDSSSETDLNNVDIWIQTPAKTITEDTNFFLHEDGVGSWQISNNQFHYSNPLLKKGKDSYIRVVFPANQLSDTVSLTKDKEMLDSILASEAEYELRVANLDKNISSLNPILIGLIVLTILIGIWLYMKHPARYRGNKSDDTLLRLVEDTDPLFVKFLDAYFLDSKGFLTNDSFLAALFSLKQRGIVTLEEVASERKEGDQTIRFTWKDSSGHDLDMADSYLYSWLFTEKDKQGEYFLLESLTAGEKASDKEKQKKAEKFQNHFKVWSEFVLARDAYYKVRTPFKPYPWLTILFTFVSFGLIYFSTTFYPISETEQLVIPIVVGALAIISVLFSKWKWVSVFYFPIALIVHTIGFTFTSATIFVILFYLLVFTVLIATPAYSYSNEEIQQLKYAIKRAKALFHKEQYPVEADPIKMEKRLEYAVVLGKGKQYAKLCRKVDFAENITPAFPLLYNPDIAITTFASHNIAIYTGTSGGTNSNTTSPTGGGGAGAF